MHSQVQPPPPPPTLSRIKDQYSDFHGRPSIASLVEVCTFNLQGWVYMAVNGVSYSVLGLFVHCIFRNDQEWGGGRRSGGMALNYFPSSAS